jgi:hypothetical protein
MSQALENGEIDENILKIALTENNFFSQSARLFARKWLLIQVKICKTNNQILNSIMAKWLAALWTKA